MQKNIKKLLEEWINYRFLHGNWQWKSEDQRLEAKKRIFGKIENEISLDEKRSASWIKPLSLAASLIVVGCLWLYLSQQRSYTTIQPNSSITKIVEPGTESAILTLEDGTTINIDDHTGGILSKNNYRTIRKDTTGQIKYLAVKGLDKTSISRNTITVPLGGLFEVVLPDETKVWLNSATSLTYPSRFTGNERKVELKGEAYFQVAKNEELPFKIIAGDNEIKVTGTEFNVSAYEDDQQVATTLIEGGVIVSKGQSQLRLMPGEQSISVTNSDYFIRKKIDTDLALGWMNGYFIFDDQDVESIMREISRWYNVEVVFKKENGNKKIIGGMFSRDKSVEDLVTFLEKLNVGKFEKSGRRITVMI